MTATTRSLLLAPLALRRTMDTNKMGAVVAAVSPQQRFKSTRPDPSPSNNNNNNNNLFLDLIASMRFKAANVLTSSLSEGERSQLLERLDSSRSRSPSEKIETSNNDDESNDINNNNNNNNHQKLQHTIAEAVAAARAQEAQRSQQKWEAEKEALLKEAEAAALARVEADLAIQKRRLQFEQWQKQVREETSKQHQQETEGEPKAPATVAAEVVSTNQQDEQTTTATAETIDAHPILGPCLLDLGYKRVHVVSTEALTAIPVWEKQRIYRHERAKKMADDKMKTLDLGLPGVLGIHEDQDGRLSILDGQHRVGMFDTLSKKKNARDLLQKVLVEVYPRLDHHRENHAQELFLEINKAEPIKLVDLPGVAKKGDRNILTAAAESLSEQYIKMFSSSQKCRAPHLNVDNLRDALFAANVIPRHNIKTAKQLQDWMLAQNELLKAKYTNEDEPARELVAKTALKKALANDFYLGLESSWYYN